MNLSGMMTSKLLLLKRMGLRPSWHYLKPKLPALA